MRTLYAFGSNGSGQLGLGHKDDVSSPTLVKLNINDESVKTIRAGGNHSLLLSESGQLYATGNNEDGRCFSSPTSSYKSTDAFQLVDTNATFGGAKVKLCAATWEASIVVLSSGQILTCGTGRHGELGHGSTNHRVDHPKAITAFPPKSTKVIDISASMNHIVTVLSNGDVYAWGAGRKGQLGSPPADQYQPRRILDLPFRATRVACGKEFTLIAGATQSNEVILLGIDKWGALSNKPSDLSSWIDVGASWSSIYVLLRSGKLLSWGRDDHQQLASNDLGLVKQLAVGSEHVVCVLSDGKVIAWGWGEHGNCGPLEQLVNYDSTGSHIQIDGEVVSVGAGCATSWLVVENG